MKLSDYVIEFLVNEGIKHSFVISGGAIVHLADSANEHPEMQIIGTQHEQAAAAAADMYSRITNNLGLCMTTSGPGATNLVTSVCNAFFDSIPIICITGQVARFRIKPTKGLRQKGFQETDIVSIFKSITKYSKLILDPNDIRYELEKAISISKRGRPGPVLLDIPDDLQREEINPEELKSYEHEVQKNDINPTDLNEFKSLLSFSKKPVLVIGAGVRISNEIDRTIKFAENLGIPFLLTWGAKDIIEYSHPLNMGGLGVCGPRGGNFAVQKSDLVIALGTRLSQMITGGKQDLFAPNAKKIMIDVDSEEINKFDKSTFELDLSINSSLTEFFDEVEGAHIKDLSNFDIWRGKIKEWIDAYPICMEEYRLNRDRVNAYVLIDELAKKCKEGDIILTDAGGNLSWTMQGFEVKKNQRVVSAWNHSPMGGSLPMAIGGAFAKPKKDIVCIIGDGGLMMCLEELATIKRHNLNVKTLVFNNRGHGIQKQTMDTWLNSRYVLVDEESGLYFPDYSKIAESFDIPFISISNQDQLKNLDKIFSTHGPIICDIAIKDDQKIEPMLKFGSGIEDLDPKIPKEELNDIMKS
ncbi:MAG: acetolactate synthase [Candidatus Marinimicrobia bacterium]|nr:acetolactate synthase [Candidatus Neomarinimicrobiota bacterium]